MRQGEKNQLKLLYTGLVKKNLGHVGEIWEESRRYRGSKIKQHIRVDEGSMLHVPLELFLPCSEMPCVSAFLGNQG